MRLSGQWAKETCSYTMAAPYNPNQQAYLPHGQSVYPEAAYVYPPQDQVAAAQYPPPSVLGYPPQGYPHQAYPPQGSPPAYDYKEDQLAYNYSPQLANTTVVVAAQPTAASTIRLSPPASEGLLGDRCMRSLVFPMHAARMWPVSHLPPSLHPCSHLVCGGPGD